MSGLDDLQNKLDDLAKPETIKKKILEKGIEVVCPNCHSSFLVHEITNNCPSCSKQINVEFKA